MSSKEENMEQSEFDLESMLQSLSAEDIDKILAENQSENIEAPSAVAGTEDADLMSLLSESKDTDARDIQDMLQRDENKELLDEVVVPEIEDVVSGLNLDGEDEGTESTDEPKSQDKKALLEERKRIRREKKEEKRKLKEAKKAEKLAAKEERKAAKEASKGAAKEAEKEASKLVDYESLPVEEELLESMFGGDLLNMEELANVEDLSDIHAVDSEEALTMVSDMDLLFAGENADILSEESVVSNIADISSLDGMSSMDGMSVNEEDISELESIKEKKVKKEKKGLFTKILDLLTEEDEEEVQENENILLSEENQEIIKEMDKEKGKKAKKSKKSKKKGKNNPEAEEASVDGEEISDKKDKPKKEKKASKKKEQKVKLEELTEVKPEKKLSFKRMLPIFVTCASLVVVIIFLGGLLSDFSTKKAGRKAFYDGDYQTCYQNLHGRELNESEQVMYGKSESILRIRIWLKEYELFASEGDRVRALDSLIQSVQDYPTLYSYASEWNAGNEVNEIYAQLLVILETEYGLTEAEAMEIVGEPDDIVYTQKVTAIAGGEQYKGSASNNENLTDNTVQKDADLLPEEDGLNGGNFIDNNK